MTQSAHEYLARLPQSHQRRRLLKVPFEMLLYFLCQVDAEGMDNIPRTGPTIIMLNHLTAIDPAICTAMIHHRYIISMAKAETLDNWFTRLVVRTWGNFIIKRGTVDRESLEIALALLQTNNLLLVAPEGTRSKTGGLIAPREGLVYLALKAQAVIVPTAVVGINDWPARWTHLRRAHPIVRFGRPFRFRGGESVNRYQRAEMMQEAMYQLALTIPDSHAEARGVFADVSQATTRYLEFLGDSGE